MPPLEKRADLNSVISKIKKLDGSGGSFVRTGNDIFLLEKDRTQNGVDDRGFFEMDDLGALAFIGEEGSLNARQETVTLAQAKVNLDIPEGEKEVFVKGFHGKRLIVPKPLKGSLDLNILQGKV